MLVLYGMRVFNSFGLFVFLVATAAVIAATVRVAVSLFPHGDPFRGVTKIILIVLATLVPVIFYTGTVDTFNITKYSVVLVGATLMAAIWIVRTVHTRRAVPVATMLRWPVLALLLWTGITTLTSSNIRISLLGQYDDYEGLYLAIAFAIVFYVTYLSFRLGDLLKVVTVFFLLGGGLEIVYGALQLHDRMFGGTPWDWVHWDLTTFSGTVWGTFGNPNHLAGYLAMMLPLGVVLYVCEKILWRRVLLGVIVVLAFIELMATASRGGFFAAVIALAVVGLSSILRSRHRARVGLFGAGAFVLACLAGSGLLLASQVVRAKFERAFAFSGDSTVVQRVQFARIAITMADKRPLVGQGPDMYQSAFYRYQSPRFVQLYGPSQIANQPHNVFANYLATEGYPGLALWCLLLIAAVVLVVRAWRQLRISSEDGVPPRQTQRLLLIGLAGALLAFVLQASFDPLQVGSFYCFWACLGLLAVLGREIGVPATLFARSDAQSEAAYVADNREKYWTEFRGESSRFLRTRGRLRHSERHQQNLKLAITVVSVIVLGVLSGLLITGETAPLRADHDYANFISDENRVPLAKTLSAKSADETDAELALGQAITTNPWEATYISTAADAYEVTASQATTSRTRLLNLEGALAYAEAAVRLDGANPAYLESEAQVFFDLATVTKEKSFLMRGITVARQAVTADPLDPGYQEDLVAAEKLKL